MAGTEKASMLLDAYDGMIHLSESEADDDRREQIDEVASIIRGIIAQEMRHEAPHGLTYTSGGITYRQHGAEQLNNGVVSL